MLHRCWKCPVIFTAIRSECNGPHENVERYLDCLGNFVWLKVVSKPKWTPIRKIWKNNKHTKVWRQRVGTRLWICHDKSRVKIYSLWKSVATPPHPIRETKRSCRYCQKQNGQNLYFEITFAHHSDQPIATAIGSYPITLQYTLILIREQYIKLNQTQNKNHFERKKTWPLNVPLLCSMYLY